MFLSTVLPASMGKVSVIGFFRLSQGAIATLLIALAGNNDCASLALDEHRQITVGSEIGPPLQVCRRCCPSQNARQPGSAPEDCK